MMESPDRWGLDRLIRFGVPGEPDIRPTLLRVLTELYVQKPAHTADEAANVLRDEVRAGRLDAEVVSAVLDSAGPRVVKFII